ncbi:uncharacterized protein MICPUCDRAFT_21888 [Micromonas pusilla CCMP1545]|uniref:Ribosome biogenesis protein WDR12 homolog n=1 Tax=Micromonas pusilla (strain CCMP1545) TaxID=564608 RepID=C1N4Z8_MICPC|nr:uncharacterized protein MICPUCDRAFT_21888 [Micromonas pusilla CCMP1545]EEH53022.1 predicted protein [Micromonas pusilla CCMP1545]|eukprot:XP_003063083.1 predicted protein [Micromonas pusilla CCMP1545]
MGSTGEETQITCKFVTRLPEKYRISPTPFAVPGKLTRYGLSEVINHLLALDPPKPFDFLVDGELVRTSLEKLLLRKGVSAESTLEVEYIPAVGPPSEEATGKHDDWVAGVCGSWGGAIATASYDGTTRLYSPKGKHLVTLDGHAQPVVAVTLLPPTEDDGNGCVVVSGGHDCVVRAWDVVVDAKGDSAKHVGSSRVFVGHEGTITSVAASPDGVCFASGSYDKTARVWARTRSVFEALGIPDPNDAKKKPAEEEEEEEEELPAGVVVLRGHTDAVTAVAWESVDVVWTGSMDHSLKSFDADAGTCVQTYAAPKCVMGLAVRAGGGMLAWCGGGDRMVHFWDPRVGNATGATTSLASHTEMVVSVAWCPGSEYQLASTAYDGNVKLWDIRGKLPLHTVKAHPGKPHTARALCVDYHGPNRVVSGGIDGRLRIFKVDNEDRAS